MKIKGWQYYNHAAIPICAPHAFPNLQPVYNGSIWKIDGGTPLLVRWTTDWDCSRETNWWYVIKDSEYNIESLKSKRRYEINKGRKNYIVTQEQPGKYAAEIYECARKAYEEYPSKYRPHITEKEFINEIKTKWGNYTFFIAKDHENKVAGYAYLADYDTHSEFLVLKTDPLNEKKGVNAAIVDTILQHYNNRLKTGGYYICDGSRSVRHQTNFQNYLEKYFGFRKAYCTLHIKMKWYINLIIILTKPFEKLFGKSENRVFYNIYSLSFMRKCSKKARAYRGNDEE